LLNNHNVSLVELGMMGWQMNLRGRIRNCVSVSATRHEVYGSVLLDVGRMQV